MFNRERLAELEETQRLLVAQAELHRGILGFEAAQLRERLSWVRLAGRAVELGRPLLVAAAALAGGAALPRWRKLVRLLPLAFSAWRWLRPFLGPGSKPQG